MSDDNLLREVDEELRRERMHRLWAQFGPWVIAAAVFVVLAVAVNEGWKWWQESTAARSADAFYAAEDLAQAGDLAGAQAAFEALAASGSGNYPLLAKFRQAALLAKDGKADAALTAYDALAGENDPQVRSLALVLAASLLADKGDVTGVETRIGAMVGPTDPMRNVAREILGLTKYQSGDLDGARVLFEQIANDPEVTSTQATRVQVYVAQLVAEGAKDPAGDSAANPEITPADADPVADGASPVSQPPAN